MCMSNNVKFMCNALQFLINRMFKWISFADPIAIFSRRLTTFQIQAIILFVTIVIVIVIAVLETVWIKWYKHIKSTDNIYVFSPERFI